MLCAKYDYKMDIAEKKEEAFQDGMEAGLEKGISQGAQQNAVQNAQNFLAMKILTPEQIAQGTGLPLEQILELQKQTTVQAKN